MFSHKTINSYFNIHRLANENGTTSLDVVPERGGIISKLVLGGKDILYLDESTLKDTSLSVRGGVPILFPICGRLQDNTYSYDGKNYTMKRHGFARNFPWQVLDIKTSEDTASISIMQEWNNETYVSYPFKYKLIYRYIINDKDHSLKIQSTFVNEDDKDLIFYAGFHPYFPVYDKANVEINVPSDSYIDLFNSMDNEGNIDFAQKEVDVSYYNLQGNTCTMKDNSNDFNIALEFDDIYKYIIVWTLEGKDFICMEPCMGSTNSLNTGKNVNTIRPNNNLSTEIKISINK